MFSTRNQTHSCSVRSVEDHLTGADTPVRELYDQLVATVSAAGPVSIAAVKSQINVRANNTFMGIKVRPDKLVVELLLPRKSDDARYTRVTALPGARFAHFVELRSADELDAGLAADMAEAYALGAR